MAATDDLSAIKRRVSGAVLKLGGVSGVGLPARGLTIYLEDDSPALREKIASALEPLRLKVDVHWEVTGKFGKF
ncbi:MAG: hypothetical protein ABI781_11400 [Burkholderiales bacterium]